MELEKSSSESLSLVKSDLLIVILHQNLCRHSRSFQHANLDAIDRIHDQRNHECSFRFYFCCFFSYFYCDLVDFVSDLIIKGCISCSSRFSRDSVIDDYLAFFATSFRFEVCSCCSSSSMRRLFAFSLIFVHDILMRRAIFTSQLCETRTWLKKEEWRLKISSVLSLSILIFEHLTFEHLINNDINKIWSHDIKVLHKIFFFELFIFIKIHLFDLFKFVNIFHFQKIDKFFKSSKSIFFTSIFQFNQYWDENLNFNLLMQFLYFKF